VAVVVPVVAGLAAAAGRAGKPLSNPPAPS
jgi:hypothetical protein